MWDATVSAQPVQYRLDPAAGAEGQAVGSSSRAGLAAFLELWDGRTSRERRSVILTCVRTALAGAHDALGLHSPAPGSRAREPAPTPSSGRLDSANSHPTTSSTAPVGQAAVAPGALLVHRLAGVAAVRDTGHGGSVASTGLALVLALEVPRAQWPPAAQRRGAGADRRHVAREPTVGHRAHQRRAPQARQRRQQPFDSTLQVAWTRTLAEPDLADVPAQPRSPSLGSRPVHRAHAHVQDAVRAGVHRPRPAGAGARQRDGQSRAGAPAGAGTPDGLYRGPEESGAGGRLGRWLQSARDGDCVLKPDPLAAEVLDLPRWPHSSQLTRQLRAFGGQQVAALRQAF